jgi:hypothetical protein
MLTKPAAAPNITHAGLNIVKPPMNDGEKAQKYDRSTMLA